jgi:homoserine dehydrogenase
MVAARNLLRAREVTGPGIELMADPLRLVRHPQVDVVVEAIGGCTDARTLVLEAIAQGKHVVTANKALLALHGDEIFAAAQAQRVIVAFEGAVAVSIPIVKALREGLAANRIEWLAGIVNGTSNHVLTEMRDKGVAFDDALREAQRLGYAEADPAFDVEGIDAAHKLALLAAMAFGTRVDVAAIDVQGISAVQPADHACARRLGYRLKLLAVARRGAQGLELRVRPTLVPARSMMAHVDGAMNAVLVQSDAAGPTLYYGAGAGSEQTASAVIADLIDVARLERASLAQRVPPLGFHAGARDGALPVLAAGDICGRHCLRVSLREGSGPPTVAALLSTLAEHGVQVETQASEGDEHVFVTAELREARMQQAMKAIEALPGVLGPERRLAVERLG